MFVVGIDEVGRGTIAGPVVACAVIMPENFIDERIKDSKKINKNRREELYKYLTNNFHYGLGVVCNKIIDEINILNATKQAMHLALSKLNHHYDKIIIDAVKLNNIEKPYIYPFKADNDYIQVSAASIIAKVYRDNLMTYLSSIYDKYGWEKNAGYGTKHHIEAIKKYGYSDIHRLSFKIKGL